MPDMVKNEYGLTICEKIIPWGAKWTKAWNGYKAGDTFKADRLMDRIEGITIHNTPDLENVEDDAEQYTRATWPNQNMGDARVHYYVDENGAWQNLLDNEVGWHAGTGNFGKGNVNTIAIEIIMDGSGNENDLKAEDNGALLTAILIDKYKLDMDCIYKHQDWSGKYCPKYILDKNGWNEFLARVMQHLIQIRTKQLKAKCVYSVQVGSFENKNNAQRMIEKLSEVGIAAYIVENEGRSEEMIPVIHDVKYSITANKTYQLEGNPADISCKIVNQKNRTIEEPNCINGTFFWYADKAKATTYPTSILIIDGKVYQNDANHLADFGTPQSVFLVYYDGRIEMKRLKHATDIDYKSVKMGVGGIGLINKMDSNFVYSPSVAEGFRAGYRLQDNKYVNYTDVLRRTDKSVIAYRQSDNKIILMTRPDIYHTHSYWYDLLELCEACEYDIALSLDGGGSSFMNNSDSMVMYGDNRRINNIIGFNL